MTDQVDEGKSLGEKNSPQQMPNLLEGGLDGRASKLISARGTEDGLVLRIDGRAEWQQIVDELTSFLGDRRRFLEGGEISIEWLDRLPTKQQSQELELLLRDRYGIEIIGRKKKHPKLSTSKEKPGEKISEKGHDEAADAIPLLDATKELRPRSGKAGVSSAAMDAVDAQFSLSIDDELRLKKAERDQLRRMNDLLGDEPFLDDEANARIVFGTLRSGQRVETPFSLIVIGDVNPGADLIAGGDIVVFGVLRGTAHAGAYDDDAQNRVILSQSMQPMQLRIGSVVSRGNDEVGRGPEVARIEDRRIIVEGFNARSSLGRRAGR